MEGGLRSQLKSPPEVCRSLEGRLIVSCQAREDSPFRDSTSMVRFARAAVDGGAAGIRASGTADVRAIRQAVSVPIIGIEKNVHDDGRILITGSFEAARKLVGAGADIIALDYTARGQRYGSFERLRQIKSELRVPVMADIATAEEARVAAAAGADLVATTMRGYTVETEHIRRFEPHFVAEVVRAVDVPVMAEGRLLEPDDARAALAAGAYAVIVGTAITRPDQIARRFVQALALDRERRRRYFLGIDLGGTYTKFGVVSASGELIAKATCQTPNENGQVSLLNHLKWVVIQCLEMASQEGVSPSALGIATAGWVDPFAGRVKYATENLRGWTGTAIRDELQGEIGLPVAVENDANALAVAEKHFGTARGCDDFICVTLGTGVGGGCYVGGKLNRGANFLATGVGHIPIEPGGIPCSCGRIGCLEVYANAAALVRYAGNPFSTAQAVVEAANAGEALARQAVQTYASYLARGCALLIQLLDPQRLILAGGLVQDNLQLLEILLSELAERTPQWTLRHVCVEVSTLGYYGGVYGGGAVALDALETGATASG